MKQWLRIYKIKNTKKIESDGLRNAAFFVLEHQNIALQMIFFPFIIQRQYE